MLENEKWLIYTAIRNGTSFDNFETCGRIIFAVR